MLCCESFKKIIKIEEGILYCIEDKSIERAFYYSSDTKYWKKITSEQFRDVCNKGYYRPGLRR